jgi:hypothetical protein
MALVAVLEWRPWTDSSTYHARPLQCSIPAWTSILFSRRHHHHPLSREDCSQLWCPMHLSLGCCIAPLRWGYLQSHFHGWWAQCARAWDCHERHCPQIRVSSHRSHQCCIEFYYYWSHCRENLAPTIIRSYLSTLKHRLFALDEHHPTSWASSVTDPSYLPW